MSLVRLLTAGKSLVDIKDSASRYRMANPASMPKFRASKNPFRVAAGVPDAKAAIANAKERMDGEKVPGPVPVVEGRPANEAAEAAQASGGTLEEPRQLRLGRCRSIWHRLSQAIVDSGVLVARWFRGLWGLWPRKPGLWLSGLVAWKPKRTASRLTSAGLQPELSLDHVTVKRNDLSEADVEVAPAKAGRMGKSVSEATSKAEPRTREEVELEAALKPQPGGRPPGQTPWMV